VCISRSVETFGRACFGSGDIRFVAFEFNPRLRIFDSDCFAFVRGLVLFSVPTIFDWSRGEGMWGIVDSVSEFQTETSENLKHVLDGETSIARSSEIRFDRRFGDSRTGEMLGGAVPESGNTGRDIEIQVGFVKFSRLSFSNCGSLAWICISNCVKLLCSKCFWSCKSLRAVTFESN
jgi:hypothetical protein